MYVEGAMKEVKLKIINRIKIQAENITILKRADHIVLSAEKEKELEHIY